MSNKSLSRVTVRGAAARAVQVKRFDAEQRIEDRLVETLEARGIHCERRVRTPCGIADVVTEDTVYEVKAMLTHDVLFKAFGQVTLYAACLGKSRRVIVGQSVETTAAMCDVIRNQGVEVRCCTQPLQRNAVTEKV